MCYERFGEETFQLDSPSDYISLYVQKLYEICAKGIFTVWKNEELSEK